MIIFIVVSALFLLVGFTVFFGAPYVPSRRRELEQVFTILYPLSKKDVLVDLGSGDGVVLRAARRYGAMAYGYEISPVLVTLSRLLAHGDAMQQTIAKSYWNAPLPAGTTVVYAFSDGRDIQRLQEKLRAEAVRLGRPLVCITYGFRLPGEVPIKKNRAYFLYNIKPCSSAEA